MWISEYNEEETMEKFKEEGRQEGLREGENLLAALSNKLLSLGKNEDAYRITTDVEYRNKLYVQYGLKTH